MMVRGDHVTQRVTGLVCQACFVSRVEVRLLGRPAVTVDGEIAAPPRGVKSWGLLAYLAASEGGRSRSEVAELLFAAAEDPLGALRWNLAALRRLLGLPHVLKGDPLRLDVPDDVIVDTRIVSAGDQAALTRPGLGDELLAGLSFAGCPLFETWLVTERQRLMRGSASLLREAALAASARGDHELAIRYATKLVSCEPFDEGYHALLIRAHTAAGDAMAAGRQFEACRQLLRSELGTEPGPAVAAALRAADALRDSRVTALSPDEVLARLAVAWQSFLSGTIDHALDVMRGALLTADAGDDESLQATTRILLGAMLGMAVRGWDEAATVLGEAYHIAERIGRPADAATALGVRAGIDMMHADYASARSCAQTGLAMSDDPGARSVNLLNLAAIDADLGDFDGATNHALSATSAARASGDPVRILYTAAHAGRMYLMRGDVGAARIEVTNALAASDDIMHTFRPWLMTMLAEIELAEGNLDAARRAAEAAATLAAVTNIAYQQALALRAIGLIDAAAGDTSAAVTHLTEALSRARRTTGEGYTFHWPIAFVLDSLGEVTVLEDPSSSQRWTAALLDHATATGMNQFAARAQARLDRISSESA